MKIDHLQSIWSFGFRPFDPTVEISSRYRFDFVWQNVWQTYFATDFATYRTVRISFGFRSVFVVDVFICGE